MSSLIQIMTLETRLSDELAEQASDESEQRPEFPFSCQVLTHK